MLVGGGSSQTLGVFADPTRKVMTALFISYRREDTQGWAGRLTDALRPQLRGIDVLRDVDDIPFGVEFDTYIVDTVSRCGGLIVLIGPSWLRVTNSTGQRRLDDPSDFIRLEIETAIKYDVLIVPVLVGGAQVPPQEELPSELRSLSRRNAFRLTDDHWNEDVRKIARTLLPILQTPWMRIRSLWLRSALVIVPIVSSLAAYLHFSGQRDSSPDTSAVSARDVSTGKVADAPTASQPATRPIDLHRTADELARTALKVAEMEASLQRLEETAEEMRLTIAKMQTELLKIAFQPSTTAPRALEAPERSVFVEAFEIKGNTVLSREVLLQLLRPYTRRSLTVAELEEARLKITQLYVERGYITSGARAVDITSTVAMVDIIEGRLSEVVVVGVGDPLRASIISELDEGNAPIQIARLRKKVERITTKPGIRYLHATLLPGKGLGEAVLRIVVEPES